MELAIVTFFSSGIIANETSMPVFMVKSSEVILRMVSTYALDLFTQTVSVSASSLTPSDSFIMGEKENRNCLSEASALSKIFVDGDGSSSSAECKYMQSKLTF